MTEVDPQPPTTRRLTNKTTTITTATARRPDGSVLEGAAPGHRAVAKFPHLSRRYQKFIGTAAVVSSALIVLSSIAVSKRMHRGESDEKILAEITPDEIENAGKGRPEKPKNKDKDNSRMH